MRPGYDRIHSHEAHLDINQWNNLDASYQQRAAYCRHSEPIWEKEELAHQLIRRIKVEVLPKLTQRQREITLLYLDNKLNEEEIAEKLGISQPTVSQHLFGKKRNGKKIGGSIQKIQKILLNTSSNAGSMSQKELTTALRHFVQDD